MKIRNSSYHQSRQEALQNAISSINKKKVQFEPAKKNIVVPNQNFLSPNMISGKNKKIHAQWSEFSADYNYPPNTSSKKRRQKGLSAPKELSRFGSNNAI